MVFDKINDAIKKAAEEKEQTFKKEDNSPFLESGVNEKQTFLI